jgi:hypothetical protein
LPSDPNRAEFLRSGSKAWNAWRKRIPGSGSCRNRSEIEQASRGPDSGGAYQPKVSTLQGAVALPSRSHLRPPVRVRQNSFSPRESDRKTKPTPMASHKSSDNAQHSAKAFGPNEQPQSPHGGDHSPKQRRIRDTDVWVNASRNRYRRRTENRGKCHCGGTGGGQWADRRRAPLHFAHSLSQSPCHRSYYRRSSGRGQECRGPHSGRRRGSNRKRMLLATFITKLLPLKGALTLKAAWCKPMERMGARPTEQA